MSTLQPTEAWILILISSILVISNVVSSDNDLQTPQRIPQRCPWMENIRNNPTPLQDQKNKQNTELMCVSSDQNIYKIAEETKNQCKGNDYIVTFYYKKDKSYTNLGSFATDKYLLQNLLKKYNNWLLTDSIADLKDKKIINDNSKRNAKQYANYNDLPASPIFTEETFTKLPESDSQMIEYSSINSSDYSNYKFNFSNEGPETSSANCEILDDIDTQGVTNGYLKSRYNSQLNGYEVFVPEEAQEDSSSIINVTVNNEVENDNNIIEVDQIEDLRDVNNGGYYKTEVIDGLLNKDYDESDFVPSTSAHYNLGKKTNTEHSMPYAIIDSEMSQNENNQVFDNYVNEHKFSPDSNNMRIFNIDLDSSEISPDSTYTDDNLNSFEYSTSSRDFATYAKQFYDTKASKQNILNVANYNERMMPLLPLQLPPTNAQTEFSESQNPCTVPSTSSGQFNIPLSTFSNPNIDSFTVQLPQFNPNSERQSFITAQYLPFIPDIIPNLDVTIETRDTPIRANNIKFLPLYAQALYGKSPNNFYNKPLLNIMPGIAQSSFQNPFLAYPDHTAKSTNFYDSINNIPESRLFASVLSNKNKAGATQISNIAEQDTSSPSEESPTKSVSVSNNLQGTYDVTTNVAKTLDTHTYNSIDVDASPYYTVNSLPFIATSSTSKPVSASSIVSSLPSPAALQMQPEFQSAQIDSLSQLITPSKSGPCAVSDMSPLYFSSFTSTPYDSSPLPNTLSTKTITKTSKVEFHESNEQFLSIPSIPTSPISKTGFTEIVSPSLSRSPCSNSVYQLVDSHLNSPTGEHFNIQTLPYMTLPYENIASLPCTHKTTYTGLTDFSHSFSPYICNLANTLPKSNSICHGVPAPTLPLLKNPYVNLVSPISFLDPSLSFTSPLVNKNNFVTYQNNASPSKASDLSMSPIITPIEAITDPVHISYYNPIMRNVFKPPQITGKGNLLSILPPSSQILPNRNPFSLETTNLLAQTITPHETSINLSTQTQPMKFIGLLPDRTTSETNPYTLYNPPSVQFSTQYSPSPLIVKDKIQHIYTPQIVSSKEMQSILNQIKLPSTPMQNIGLSADTTLKLRSSMISDSPKFINPVEYIKPLPLLSNTLAGRRPTKPSLPPCTLSDISWIPTTLPINHLKDLCSKNNMLHFPTPIFSPLQPPEKLQVSLSPYLPSISPLIDSTSEEVVQYLSTPLISPLQPSEKISTVLLPPISEKNVLQYSSIPIVSPLQSSKYISKTLIQPNLPENPLIDSSSKEIVEFLSKPIISALQPSEKIKMSPIPSLSSLSPLIDSKSKNILQYLSAPIISPLQPSEKIVPTFSSLISPRTRLINSVSSANPFITLTPKEAAQYFSKSQIQISNLPKLIVSPLQPPEKITPLLSTSLSPLIDSQSKEIEQYLPTPLISSLQPPEKIRLPSSASPTFSLTDSKSKEILQYLPKPIVSPLQPPEKVRSLLLSSVSPLTDSKSKGFVPYLSKLLISPLQPPENVRLSLSSSTSPTFPLIDSASKEILQYLPKPIVSSLQPPEKVKLLSPCISPTIDSKSKVIVPYLPTPLISPLQSPERIRLSLPSFPLVDSTSNEVLQYLPKPIMSPLQPPEKIRSLLSPLASPLINAKSNEIEQYLPTPLISSLQPPEKMGLLLPTSPRFPLIDSTSNEILQYLAKPIVSPLQSPEKVTPLLSPPMSALIDSKSKEIMQHLPTPLISPLQPLEKVGLLLPSPVSPRFPLIDSTSNEILQYLAKPIVSPLQLPEKITPLLSSSPSMSALTDSKSKEIEQYLPTPLISSLQPPEKVRLLLPSPMSPKFPLTDSTSKQILQYLAKPIVSPLQPPEKIKQMLSPSMSALTDSKSKEIVQYLPTPLISSLQPPEKIRLSLLSHISPKFPLIDSTSKEIIQYLEEPIFSPLQLPEKITPLLSLSPSKSSPLIDSISNKIEQYLPMPLISSLQPPEKIPVIPSMSFTSPLLFEKLQKSTPCTSKLIISPLQPPEPLNLRTTSPTASANKQSCPTYTGHTFYSNLKPTSTAKSQPVFTSMYSNLPMTHLNIGSYMPKNSNWFSVYSKILSKLSSPLPNIKKPQPSDTFLYITPLSLPGTERNVFKLLKTSFPTPQYMTSYSNLPLKEALNIPSPMSGVGTYRNTITYLPTKSPPTATPSFTPLFTPPHSSTTDSMTLTQYYSPFSVKYSNMPTNKPSLLPTSMPVASPNKMQFSDVFFSNLPIPKPLNSQANTANYIESFSNIKTKPPLKFQNIIEYIDKLPPAPRAPEIPITYGEYAKPCKHSYKPLPSPYKVAYSNMQKHNSQINSMYEYLPYSNSYIDPTRDLKTSVYNYVRNEEIKPNLYNALNEVNVPLGTFIIANRDCVNTTTENINSAIDLKVWPSDKMKLVEAKLVLRLVEIEGRNFAPVVKNGGQYNANEIENITTNYIQNKYGNVIKVRNANKQYEIIRVNNISNNYNLLWPANTCTAPC